MGCWCRELLQQANELGYLWVGAMPQVLWRHLLSSDHVQSPGSQPGGSGQLWIGLHLSRHPAPHHPLHAPPCPPAFPLSSFSQPLSRCLAAPPAILTPCLHSSLSAPFASNHNAQQTPLLCKRTEAITHSSPSLSLMGRRAHFTPSGFGLACNPQEAICGLLDFSSLSPPQGFVLALGR